MKAISITSAAAALLLAFFASASFAVEPPQLENTEKPGDLTIDLDPARAVHVQADVPGSDVAPLEKCTSSPTPVLQPIRRVLLVDQGLSGRQVDALAKETVAYWEATAPDNFDANKVVLVAYDVESGEVGVGVGDAWRPEGGVINMTTFWTWVNWRYPKDERDLDEYVCAMLDGLALNAVRTHFRHVLGPKDMPKKQANLIRRVQNSKWKLDGTVESLAGLVNKGAPALTELKRTAGEAQILYFEAECLAFAGDRETAEMRLDRASELADEARSFIQSYRDALDEIEALGSRLDQLRDDIDEDADGTFFDGQAIRSQLRTCESKQRALEKAAKEGVVLTALEDQRAETERCISDLRAAYESELSTHQNIVFGGPLLFLFVVLPVFGFLMVQLRRRASEKRLPVAEAISEWDERRPLFSKRLEDVRQNLGIGEDDTPASAADIGLSGTEARDVATAFALFTKLDARFNEADQLHQEAGGFSAGKLKTAYELVVDGEVTLEPSDIDEASPVAANIGEARSWPVFEAVSELDELTGLAVQHTET